MSNMGISYMVKNIIQNAEVTIDGGKSSSEPIPFRGVIMGEVRMSVLEVRDESEEGIYYHKGHHINFYKPDIPH